MQTIKDPKRGYEELMQLNEEGCLCDLQILFVFLDNSFSISHPESRTRNPDALSKIATRKRELKDALEKLLSKFNATNKGVMLNFLARVRT